MDTINSRKQRQQIAPATSSSRSSSPDIMGGAYRTPPPAPEVQTGNLCELAPLETTMGVASFQEIEIEVSRPTTPEPESCVQPWHGLATPGSPQFSDIECNSGGENDTNLHDEIIGQDMDLEESIVDFDTLASPKHDDLPSPISDDSKQISQQDEVALLLLEGPRRSSRVRQRAQLTVVTKPQATRVLTQAKQTTPSTRPTTSESTPAASEGVAIPSPPHSSLSYEAIAQISFDADTDILSADWQLKWPPGGSTHPSYPYPASDPRLLFDTRIIPVIDGVPRIQDLPPIALPIGWKHVSWNGLLPIAFDPYHQAFKLTAVGPLALTHEEVQQNALCKFVPGGLCHPETGLLPDVAQFGDGSTGNDLNLEGASWTLPFLDLGIGQPSNHVNPSLHEQDEEKRSDEDTNSSREQLDCPDQVYDLEDAWRWLIGREEKPYSKFEPTAGKKWHGTGAVRSSRKLKMPLPEMMAYAIEDNFDQLDVFRTNQDSRPERGLSMFCAFESVATAWTARISLLSDTELTIIELLSFFPQHIQWYHAAKRLTRAAITPQYIFKIINMTRQLSGVASTRRSTVASYMATARKRLSHPNPSTGDDTTEQHVKRVSTTTYTAEGWELGGNYNVHDYPLLALAHGVQQLPIGVDAGPVTNLLHWCRSNQRYKAMLSDVPALLKEARISSLIEPGESGCPDKEVVRRFSEKLKVDHKRVSRSLEDLEVAKTDNDAEGQGGRKKRKIT